MNILFIHEIDWIEKVVIDLHFLAEALSLKGHNIFVIDYENTWRRNGFPDMGSLRTREISPVPRAFSGASVSLRRPGFIKIPALSRVSAAGTHFFEIGRTIREKDIDVIVLYSVPTNGLQTLYWAKKYNVPVVFRSIDILNMLVPNFMLRPITKVLEKRVYPRADSIVTLTPSLSSYVMSLGAEESRVEYVPMMVDTNLFHPAPPSVELRQKWGFGEKDCIIVFIGTLFEFSGLDVVINRFPEVLEQVPEARLLIVGDGLQRPELEEIISRLGLQKEVTITGFQPFPEMPQYINLGEMVINPFLFHGATRDIFPGKTVQYLACGKAVIATALPGMKAVIEGEEQGVLYIDSAEETTAQMVLLLQSAGRRQRLEEAALRYVGSVHSHTRVTDDFESILKRAVEEKEERSRN